MDLELLPVPCRCGRHSRAYVAPGMTHGRDEPCPFKDDRFPINPLATCCSLHGEVALRQLEALGDKLTSGNMQSSVSAEEAVEFAESLRTAAYDLEKEHEYDEEKPEGAGWNRVWDSEANEWDCQTHSTFEEAIADIRQAADWYEKVGKLGFGVLPWF